MSPNDLRARARELQKEARELVKQAEALESEAAAEVRRQRSREAREAIAARSCRPVWKVPPDPVYSGVYVVTAIDGGCFMVRDLMTVGGAIGPHPYRCRDGRYGGSYYDQVGDGTRRAILDNVATMIAWRAWCATRKEVTE